jgi:hypothetical protein
MTERVLFISSRCDHCKKILIGFQQHDFLKSLFKVVNIDKQPFPNYIKSVPSILINDQVIKGDTVFEYFGKLVEGKNQQEQRKTEGNSTEQDQGQCRINDEGELEGWCGSDSGIGFAMITEESDDYTKKTYKLESNYDMLEGGDIKDQVQNMEEGDSMIASKKNEFDGDLERMQQERGLLMQQQTGPGGMNQPPPGMNQPGMGQGMNQPGMGQQSMGQGMNQPGMGQGMNQPGMGQGMNQPGMGQGMNQPGMGQGMNQPSIMR